MIEIVDTDEFNKDADDEDSEKEVEQAVGSDENKAEKNNGRA